VRHIPPLLTHTVLLAGIACGTAWTWLTLTTSRVLSPGAVIVCTAVSVAVALAVEHAVRRAHARPHTPKGDAR
jgi:hypothetical protein